ncbi:uncharacterized protein LOC116351575, partial [Contarinia nasturtii]|uniref:uncharacterized protein LOC116351575 n=1 Tax=Contarinia nasturtii TaxID=265458 RepID=UPI0012D40C9B
LQSHEVFKHRELGILSRRPPLKWCRELRYLTDPEKPSFILQSSTPKPYGSFADNFMKKYEKFLRKESTSITKANASYRKLNKNILTDNSQRIHSDITFHSQTLENGAREIKNENDEHIYYENLWPKINNLRTKGVRTVKSSENGHLTALASFPGSGNTWLRYLLQQATGIYTGSVYKDFGLLKSGFPAEHVCNSSVLVVKTHEWGQNAWSKFSRAILLVRDPSRSILAEFNRQSGGHVGFASPERYKRTKGRYW